MTPDETSTNQLTILLYHAVVRSPLAVPHPCFLDERTFRNQMYYLKTHYLVLSLSEAVDRLVHGAIVRPTVVVTFDDGYDNNFEVAYPILRALEIPATVFLVTGFIQTSATPWFCCLHRALSETSQGCLEWQGRRYDLNGRQARDRASGEIRTKLKTLPHPQLLYEMQEIVSMLGDSPDRPVEAGSPFRMLSQDAVGVMAASGLVEFGAHTHSHPILPRLAPQQAAAEIEQSVDAVQRLTNQPCQFFAYPNGLAGDYDAGVMATLHRLGIRAAVTAIDGTNDQETPLLELRRRGLVARESSHAL